MAIITEPLNILLKFNETSSKFSFNVLTNDELTHEMSNNELRFTKITRDKTGSHENLEVNLFFVGKVDFLQEFESVFIRDEHETSETTEVSTTTKPQLATQITVRKAIHPLEKNSVHYIHKCENCNRKFRLKKHLADHLRAKTCQKQMIIGTNIHVVRCLSYLPEGLRLPDLNTIRSPYNQQIRQDDGTITYINKTSVTSYLWVTNFDVHEPKCEICQKKLLGVARKMNHRASMHFFPGNKKTCNGCGKLVNNKEDQKFHTLYCLGKDTIRTDYCYECKMRFNDDEACQKHIKRAHYWPRDEENDDESAYCHICERMFASKFMLRRHNLRHKASQMLFLCEHCHFVTSSKEKLESHLISMHFPQLKPMKTTETDTNPDEIHEISSVFVPEMNFEDIIAIDSDGSEEKTVSEGEFEDCEETTIDNSYSFEPTKSPNEADLNVKCTIVRLNDDGSKTKHDVQHVKLYKRDTPKISVKVVQAEELKASKRTNQSRTVSVKYPEMPIKVVNLDQIPVKIAEKKLKMVKNNFRSFFEDTDDFENDPSGTSSDYSNQYLTSLMTLNYLPSYVTLPVVKDLERPFYLLHEQEDGSYTYLHQKTAVSKIWITNFDLQCLECDICAESFPKEELLALHRMEEHFFPADTILCNACEKTFETRQAREFHSLYCVEKDSIDISGIQEAKILKSNNEENDTKNRKFSCNHCDFSASLAFHLLRHLLCIHFPTFANFECSECNPKRYFLTKAKYKRHMTTHETSKFECHFCGKEFNSRGVLRNHITYVHKQTDEKYPCEICGKIFLAKSNLHNHKLSHLPENERPYKCQVCGKRFNHPKILREHMYDHTGEKPYKCQYCERTFSRLQTRRDHERTHTGKGYICEYCDRSPFWDHSSFRKHLKSHELTMNKKLTYTKEERRLKTIGLLNEYETDGGTTS
ncbi:protein suppressor of hairy wing-like [Culicoides brevitarsis]|uniref:protein suppressor of hairy wing-like n=1 Tax=Culicoides brevitarsis TaxID=469753 RepID=UPI00307B4CCA